VKVCISIDLDNYQDYQSLVDVELDGSPPSFFRDAVPRFLDTFDRRGIKATFFLIGRDAAVAENRDRVREIASRGHEVGNHSYTHPYNFRALTREQKVREITDCESALSDVLGERPVGFRTPSCEVDLELLEILVERGYLYDSSVFPTPVMWAFMVYGMLFIKHEEYQLGDPMVAFAPTEPYVPSASAVHRRARNDDRLSIVELPFSTITPLRVPFYSTLLRTFGPRVLDRLILRYARTDRRVLHALFHQIEFADFRGTALEVAMGKTPALGIPFEKRKAFLEHAMESLSSAGECVTLRDCAREEFVRLGLEKVG